MTINAGGIDYGIYFNFDIDNKILEISNQSTYNEEMYLDDIIDVINERYDEEYIDETISDDINYIRWYKLYQIKLYRRNYTTLLKNVIEIKYQSEKVSIWVKRKSESEQL